MQTLIHYSTPPGWHPKQPLPALRRIHARPGPQLRNGGPARTRPPTRTGVRPAPQPARLDVELGLPWPAYLAAVVFGIAVMVVCVWGVARGQHRLTAPALGAAVAMGLGLSGLVDYARRGAGS